MLLYNFISLPKNKKKTSILLPATARITMPGKMAKLCRGEAVIVSVYAERPGKRRVSSSSSNSHHHHHHHHHHYVHHVIKQEVNLNKNGDSGKGYSRRAELLHCSQRLRESALSATSAPLVPKPVSSNHHHQPTTNIVAAPSKPGFSRSTSPACLGNWKILIPNICRSLTSIQAKQKKKKKHTGSTSNAMKAVMKTLEGQEEGIYSETALKTAKAWMNCFAWLL